MTAAVHRGRERLSWIDLALIGGAALAPRLVLVVFAPSAGGDWALAYRPVAENIYLNFCVSLSDPVIGSCDPHWGGNQLPGFPLFVALVWLLFPFSETAVRVAQTGVLVLALCYLTRAVYELTGSRVQAFLVAAVLAVSPQHLAWARFLLTETLSLAATYWVFAELFRSLHQGRLRVLQLGLALAAAVFVRYDNALLLIPAALCGFLIHPPWPAIRRSFIVFLLLAAPLSAWTVRAIAHGLPPFPAEFFSKEFPIPRGYLDWGYSWTTSQYQYPGWYNPAVRAKYSRIWIDPAIYDSLHERKQVEALLTELREYEGEAMPAHIDAAFAALAAARKDAYRLRHWLVTPALRILNMWFNPYNSTAWPVGVGFPARGDPGQAEISTFRRAVEIATRRPLDALVKIGAAVYRLLLLGLAAYCLFRSFVPALASVRAIVWMAVSYATVRTLFFAYLPLVETRYIMSTIPALELAVAISLFLLWQNRRRKPSMGT